MTNTTKLTPGQQAAIDSMTKTGGKLMVYPENTTHQDLIDLESRGLITHKFYGSATFGHVDYILTSQGAERPINRGA